MINSLSGRFLILTIAFVMLAEVMIFVPSVARFREDYLRTRLERAQIASLVLLMSHGLGLGAAARVVLPYPTRGEYLKRLADACNRRRLTPRVAGLMRRWLAWRR